MQQFGTATVDGLKLSMNGEPRLSSRVGLRSVYLICRRLTDQQVLSEQLQELNRHVSTTWSHFCGEPRALIEMNSRNIERNPCAKIPPGSSILCRSESGVSR
jgi:hypothetical protein